MLNYKMVYSRQKHEKIKKIKNSHIYYTLQNPLFYLDSIVLKIYISNEIRFTNIKHVDKDY